MSRKTRELKSPTDECFDVVDECATLFQILSVTDFKDPKLHRSTAFPFPFPFSKQTSPNVGQVPRCWHKSVTHQVSSAACDYIGRVKWFESANMVH
jgi:hypothetical protein